MKDNRDYKSIKPLMIIGAGGLGREVAWLVDDINKVSPEWKFMGFIDDGIKGSTVEGYPILGSVEFLLTLENKPWVVVAIANTKVRKNIVERLLELSFNLATLIHPSVHISDFISVGKGSIICCGSIITTNVTLGNSCILNPGCFVGHDTALDDYVSLMPGANIAGEVVAKTGCFFGLNACVINRKTVGEWSTIGAGATVVDHIPSYALAVGVPARIIKHY